MVGDLEKSFEMDSDFKNYEIAFAEYTEDKDGTIYIQDVEAIDWDEDDEFFLIPKGMAKHFELEATKYTAQSLYERLLTLPELFEYELFARSKNKIAKDGTVCSINSPLWATNFLKKDRILYFQHGDSIDD
jgi:hypothetical protein